MHRVLTDVHSRGQLAATPVRRTVFGLSCASPPESSPAAGRQHRRLSVRDDTCPALPAHRSRNRCFQRQMVGAVVCKRSLMAAKETPSASIRISLARNTNPAGKDRDCAISFRSARCCSDSGSGSATKGTSEKRYLPSNSYSATGHSRRTGRPKPFRGFRSRPQ